MKAMYGSFMEHCAKALTILVRVRKRVYLDKHERAFVKMCREKWAVNNQHDGRPVVLVDLFETNVVACCYIYIGHTLAKLMGARVEFFHFAKTNWTKKFGLNKRILKIYSAGGGGLAISMAADQKIHAEAKIFSRAVMSTAKSKKDILDICMHGIWVGDLIGQTFNRRGHEEIELGNPKLEEVIYDAFVIASVSAEYLSKTKVSSILISHTIFIHYGILSRLAAKMGIPIFSMKGSAYRKGFGFNVIRLHPEYLVQEHPYWLYHEEFEKLASEDRQIALAHGRDFIKKRISGSSDEGMKINQQGIKSPWDSSDHSPIFKLGMRPKMLVMLSCFFDGNHFYRNALFADFWDWVTFTLDTAKKTEFDWHVKPHPSAMKGNERVVDRLKKKYPWVHFLDAKVSNRRMVDEGLTAVFNPHGTSLHQFAYMGVPTVGASDVPHIAYNFCHLPKTIKDYEFAILNADSLKRPGDSERLQIEEYVYMHYIHPFKGNEENARPIDEGFEDYMGKVANGVVEDSKGFDYFVKTDSREKDMRLERYISSVIKRYSSYDSAKENFKRDRSSYLGV